MLRRKWFHILLLISLGFEVYMLLTYNSTYLTMLNKEEQPLVVLFFNILYTAFIIACFYMKHLWAGVSIFLLSCLRDLILIPNGIYSPAFAFVDSIICIFIMLAVCKIEYSRIKTSLIFKPSWTEQDIQSRSEINNSFITVMTQRFFNYETDPQEIERKQKHHCKLCEYVQDNIKAGTQLHCLMCGKELNDEYIAKLCPECAKKHDACVWCGGKMN